MSQRFATSVVDRGVQRCWSMSRAVRVAAAAAAGLVIGGVWLGASMARKAAVPAAAADPQGDFKTEVRALLQTAQFARLDALAGEFARTQARFPGGDWKSHRLVDVLSCPPGAAKESDQTWERHLALLRRWLAERPESITAAIALADGSVCYGWKARGGGYSDAVSDEGWRLLNERMAPAEGILLDVARKTAKTPEWYRAMIDLGRVQSWERDRVTGLFDAAIALEPRYLHVYSAMARYLMPRWQGAKGDWERFADESAERLAGREGSVVYGHIAWQISTYYSGQEFYEQNRVSWPRLKQGFLDREALYGSSNRTLNAFCKLAGAAGDRNTTRQLLARIGQAWDADVWTEYKYFDGYWKWAFE
jgi:hypothetical protein